MTELNRAEEYAVYSDGSPRQLLGDVQSRMQKEFDSLLEQKKRK